MLARRKRQNANISMQECRSSRISSLSHRPKLLRILTNNSVKFLTFLSLLKFTTTPVKAQILTEDISFSYVGCYTERTDLLKESIYAKTTQTCVEICERQSFNYAILSAERCFCSNDLIQSEKQDDRLCNTRCLANKSQYCGGIGVHSYYLTAVGKQPAPNHLKVANVTENSITITWQSYKTTSTAMHISEAEMTSTQPINNFLIKLEILRTYSSLPRFKQPEFIVQSIETSFEITDLQPATEYNITVEAICGAIDKVVCGSGSLTGVTEIGQPSPIPAQPRVLSSTDSTITVEIPQIKNDNGPVTKLLIIVERVDPALSQPFDTELLGSWLKAQDDGLPYYIAAELDYQEQKANEKREFVVGDGRYYGIYQNEPLDNKNSDNHISLGVISSLNGVTKILYTRSTHDQHMTSLNNFTYATFDSGRESIIALTVTCIIFGICFVLSVVAYFYLRYKTCQQRVSRRRNAHEMTLQTPIIERENNGFIVEDELPPTENFKQQLNALLEVLDASKRLPRNALRMNVNDVIADGRYGEVITGKLISISNSLQHQQQQQQQNDSPGIDCHLHVLSLDELSKNDQSHLLQDFRKLTQLQHHENILEFYGISASADWFYFVFEQQSFTLKRRLVESRRVPNSAPIQRLSAFSEELILQWIYEIANALEYLSKCKIVHKQLCSHSIFVTAADTKIKIGLFGPIPYASSNQKKVDITRWLAPEVLRYQHFSTKSDIWSFACVAWECCTLGATPYANITNNQQLLDAIKSGSRPAQPAFVYEDLYQLLLNCWQLEPNERLNFEEITLCVRQLMTSPRHALCFDRIPETAGNNVVETMPFYLPMLEMIN